MKKIFVFIVLILNVVFLSSCKIGDTIESWMLELEQIIGDLNNEPTYSFPSENENSSYDVLDVKLSHSSISLNVGETFTLTATIYPNYATNKKIYWTSENSNIVSVSSTGVLTAKSAGKTVIYATSNNGVEAYCQVEVVKTVFSEYATYKNTYYVEELKYYNISNNQLFAKSTSNIYNENNIRYAQGIYQDSSGEYNMYRYYDYNNMYQYSYNDYYGLWLKSKFSYADDGGFDGWWDIKNYNLIDGVYYLKSSINAGDIQERKIYFNSSGQIVIEQKYVYSGDNVYIKSVITYIKGNATYNLKLPTSNIKTDTGCSTCDGFGRLICGVCGGSKRMSCNMCYYYYNMGLTCYVCQGRGWRPCTNCTSIGNVDCPYC